MVQSFKTESKIVKTFFERPENCSISDIIVNNNQEYSEIIVIAP